MTNLSLLMETVPELRLTLTLTSVDRLLLVITRSLRLARLEIWLENMERFLLLRMVSLILFAALLVFAPFYGRMVVVDE